MSCLEELEFYETEEFSCVGPVKVTENLRFVGAYTNPDFIDEFNRKHFAIQRTFDDVSLGNRQSTELTEKLVKIDWQVSQQYV